MTWTPRTIAPLVTTTTPSPAAWRSATTSQMWARTSARSAPLSSAVTFDPSLMTTRATRPASLRGRGGALAGDARQPEQRRVGQRRGERADAVGDEPERQPEVGIRPAPRAAVAVMAERARRVAPDTERRVIAQPPAHAQAEHHVRRAHLHAAERIGRLGGE